MVAPADPQSSLGLLVGGTYQLTAFLLDSADNVLPARPLDWASSDPATATVSSDGLVSGLAAGTVTITAGVQDISGEFSMSVLALAASLEFLPARLGLVPGGVFDLVVVFRDASGAQLDPNGREVTWANSDASVSTVAGGINALVTGLAPGISALTANGSGASAGTEVDVSLVTFQRLVAGNRQSCGVTVENVLYCWGSNVLNLLASPVGSWSVAPFRIEGVGDGTLDVAPGGGHVCALTLAGESRCWGNGSAGNFGDGTSDPSVNGVSTPRITLGGHEFSRIVVNDASTCGLTSAGQAYCWGRGTEGQIGNGETDEINTTPVAVSGGLNFTALSAHPIGRFACGLAPDGQAYCWGTNEYGQIGDGTTTTALVPTPVSGGLAFTAIAAGVRHACGITAGGAAYCWGDNALGQLGQSGEHPTPGPVDGGLVFSHITAGMEHTCGVAAGGAYCWGNNQQAQLGDGSTVSSPAPVAVTGGLAFATVTAGATHTCGLSTEGVAYCWGFSDGIGSDPGGMVLVPRRVSGQP